MERIKLRRRILEKYGSLVAFAKNTGTTVQTVGNVLRGANTPKGLTFLGWCAALDIPEDQAYIVFAEGLENQTPEV